MRILNLLLGMSLFFITVSHVKAEALTEEQITKKIQCKSASPFMDKVNLEECMNGKYEIARYNECGKANVSEEYFNECVNGGFTTVKYNDCIKILNHSEDKHFSSCLKSNASLDHKKSCGSLNSKYLKYSNSDLNCFDDSIKSDSLNLCLKKLSNYKEETRVFFDDYSMYLLKKNGGLFSDDTLNAWFKDDYINFLKNCYTADSLVFSTCFDYFEKGEDGALNRVGECISYQSTAEDIKKCDTILNKPKNKKLIINCLEEFHAAKVANESSTKVDEVLNSSQTEGLKAGDKNLNGDNRYKHKGVAVKESDHNKVNGSDGKNH